MSGLETWGPGIGGWGGLGCDAYFGRGSGPSLVVVVGIELDAKMLENPGLDLGAHIHA
jgi:hypothetical protein